VRPTAPALTLDQLRHLRLRSQRLVRATIEADAPANVGQLVYDICGVQAQDATSARLALRARCDGATEAGVERARVVERSLVRTWMMRGTLHVVATEDVGWLLALFGPRSIAGGQRRYAELGLTEAICTRAVAVIRAALEGGVALTRAELAQRLDSLDILTAGQAIIHLICRAALEGVVCYGPDRAGKPTFVLLEDWIVTGSPLSAEEATTALARRYVAAYGPAGPGDMAAWSGLTIGAVRAAWSCIAQELLEVDVAGTPMWFPRTRAAWLDTAPSAEPHLRLLPAYDPLLLGYRGRDIFLEASFARHIHPGGGLFHPALLVNGIVAGSWRFRRVRDYVEFIVEPFAALPAVLLPLLQAEAQDVGRFLGTQGILRVQH
jgi:hypothetical protein